MTRLLNLLIVALAGLLIAPTVHAAPDDGMLFIRWPAAARDAAEASQITDALARVAVPGWAVMSPDNASVLYAARDGSIWACPGNGDRRLTPDVWRRLLRASIGSGVELRYSRRGDLRGYTRVTKITTRRGAEYLTDAEMTARNIEP